MAKFNLDSYATVNERIELFTKDFPEGSIQTFIRHLDDPVVVMEARVFRTVADVPDGVYTSGFSREVEGISNVNTTSHLENCETSAIGRALANMGYGVSKERSSRSEMLKVERMNRERDTFVEYIIAEGGKLADDATLVIDGETVEAKAYIRNNWEAITEQFVQARTVALAIQKATGTAIEVPATA